jgi:NAD(P)-dependent dehydrogenase (short-subunit alcohol dehydrogenase family)
MLKNGGGGIVNTASVAGLQALPTAPAYVGAKHGVAGLTKTVAPEFAQRAIRINAVCPGFVRNAAGRSLPRQGRIQRGADPRGRAHASYGQAGGNRRSSAVAVLGCVLVRDGAADAG